MQSTSERIDEIHLTRKYHCLNNAGWPQKHGINSIKTFPKIMRKDYLLLATEKIKTKETISKHQALISKTELLQAIN